MVKCDVFEVEGILAVFIMEEEAFGRGTSKSRASKAGVRCFQDFALIKLEALVANVPFGWVVSRSLSLTFFYPSARHFGF